MRANLRHVATWVTFVLICVTSFVVGRRIVEGDPEFLGTVLLQSAEDGDIPALADALRRGANVEFRDPVEHCTPLISAARANEYGAMDLLLASGAAVNARCASAGTALVAAARRGNVRAVTRLLDAGADPNAANERGETAIWMACWIDSVPSEVVSALLSRGADPRIASVDGESAFDVAADGRRPEKAWLLERWEEFRTD